MLPLLLLSACASNPNTVSFNENLKFDKLLDKEETEAFYERLDSMTNNILKIEVKGVVKTERAFKETTDTIEGVYDFYTNSASYHLTDSIESKEYGVSYKQERSLDTETWVVNKNRVERVITYSKTSDSDEPTINVTSSDNVSTTGLIALLNGYISSSSDPNSSNPFKVYVDGSEYAIVASYQTKTVLDIAVGSSSKEYVEETNSQFICRVDSNYYVTEATYVSEYSTNRDPDTNEWYKKTKTLSSSKITVVPTYGTLYKRAETELKQLLAGTTIIWNVTPIIKTAYYNGSSSNFPSSVFTPTETISNTTITYNKIDDINFTSSFMLTNVDSSTISKANAFFEEFEFVIEYLDSGDFELDEITKIVTSYNAILGNFNEGITSDQKGFFYPLYGSYPRTVGISCNISKGTRGFELDDLTIV